MPERLSRLPSLPGLGPRLPRLRLELRTERSRFAIVGVSIFAVAATFAVAVILLAMLGKSPVRVADAFFVQPLSSVNGLAEIVLKTGPLLLIAQGLAVGYRADVWNIGAEGQLIIGGHRRRRACARLSRQ
jgi:general nucleoside transport system permease protein